MNINGITIPEDNTPAGLSPKQLELRAALMSLPDVDLIEVEDGVFEVAPQKPKPERTFGFVWIR